MCSVRPIELIASNWSTRHVAVVQVAHLGQVGQAGLGDRLGCAHSAWRRDRVTPSAFTPYSRGGVHDHAAPAAADVQQPHARLAASSLRATRSCLANCACSRVALGVGEDRAGVGHRRAEQPLVELVGHVVVVGDGRLVALLRVPAAAQPGLHAAAAAAVAQPHPAQLAQPAGAARPRAGRQREPGDGVEQRRTCRRRPRGRRRRRRGPGPACPARWPGRTARAARRCCDADRRRRRAGLAAVVGREPRTGSPSPSELPDDVRDLHHRSSRLHRTHLS